MKSPPRAVSSPGLCAAFPRRNAIWPFQVPLSASWSPSRRRHSWGISGSPAPQHPARAAGPLLAAWHTLERCRVPTELPLLPCKEQILPEVWPCTAPRQRLRVTPVVFCHLVPACASTGLRGRVQRSPGAGCCAQCLPFLPSSGRAEPSPHPGCSPALAALWTPLWTNLGFAAKAASSPRCAAAHKQLRWPCLALPFPAGQPYGLCLAAARSGRAAAGARVPWHRAGGLALGAPAAVLGSGRVSRGWCLLLISLSRCCAGITRSGAAAPVPLGWRRLGTRWGHFPQPRCCCPARCHLPQGRVCFASLPSARGPVLCRLHPADPTAVPAGCCLARRTSSLSPACCSGHLLGAAPCPEMGDKDLKGSGEASAASLQCWVAAVALFKLSSGAAGPGPGPVGWPGNGSSRWLWGAGRAAVCWGEQKAQPPEPGQASPRLFVLLGLSQGSGALARISSWGGQGADGVSGVCGEMREPGWALGGPGHGVGVRPLAAWGRTALGQHQNPC